eukprot:3373928-Rhodomonas_salina.1
MQCNEDKPLTGGWGVWAIASDRWLGCVGRCLFDKFIFCVYFAVFASLATSVTPPPSLAPPPFHLPLPSPPHPPPSPLSSFVLLLHHTGYPCARVCFCWSCVLCGPGVQVLVAILFRNEGAADVKNDALRERLHNISLRVMCISTVSAR